VAESHKPVTDIWKNVGTADAYTRLKKQNEEAPTVERIETIATSSTAAASPTAVQRKNSGTGIALNLNLLQPSKQKKIKIL
jgi:hypothetical protein